MRVAERVLLRLGGEPADAMQIQDYTRIIIDRLCLRLREDILPVQFEGIAADAVVKMYRRTYFEGISSEGTDGITTSFVDDILSEYEGEIQSYIWKKERDAGEHTLFFL